MDQIERLAAYYAACCNPQRRLEVGPQSIGWGILGASTIAEQQLIRAIRQQPSAPTASQIAGAWVVAVFSHNERRGRDFARVNHIPHADVNLADLLQRREIQAVCVSSHPRHHYPLTMAALAAGKHVLCETPLALTLEEAKTAYQTALDRGLVLSVNHTVRGNPAIQKIRGLLQQGAIGDLLGGRLSNPTLLSIMRQTWRLQGNGGGVIFDRTIHAFDLLRHLLVDEIKALYAVNTQHILQGTATPQCEEDVLVQVHMQRSGLTFQVHDSFVIGHQPSTLELYGSHGALHLHNWFEPQAASQLWLWRHAQGEPVAVPPLDPHWQTVYAFMAAIRNAGSPLAHGADGVASLAAALAAHRSIRERVSVPVPPAWS